MFAGLAFHGSNTENDTYFSWDSFLNDTIMYMEVLGKLLRARFTLVIIILRLL